MKKLWQTQHHTLHPLIESYTVGDDHLVDLQLLPYDIQASRAHALMLFQIKILSKNEWQKLDKGLKTILELWKKGKFTIQQNQEDGHTAIEQFLTAQYGDIGQKIHTGRSRNDQALVMIRLFMIDHLKEVIQGTKNLIKIFEAKRNLVKGVKMPGYTHSQKAMPVAVDLWLESYKDALKDILPLLKSTQKIINQNPLGSGAGFGTGTLNIDRNVTTKYLKLQKTQKNPLYCAFSRGFFEFLVLQNLYALMIIAARFAEDMLHFTSSDTNFFSLPDVFTTGSSMMPQKKNYDLFEVMRAKNDIVGASTNQIAGIISRIGSGYHRDLQLTKKPLIESIKIILETLTVLITVIPHIQIHKENLQTALTKEIFMTEEVYKLVQSGIPFRKAYQQVKNPLPFHKKFANIKRKS